MERLHLYLNGALSPGDLQALEAHLAACAECAQALAELAAEDAALTGALGLDPSELAWIDSVDLVQPVMAEVASPQRDTPLLALVVLLLGLAGYLGGNLWRTLVALLPEPDVGSIIDLVRTAGPGVIRLVRWLGGGGILGAIWPGLLVGAAIGFGYVLTKRGGKSYA